MSNPTHQLFSRSAIFDDEWQPEWLTAPEDVPQLQRIADDYGHGVTMTPEPLAFHVEIADGIITLSTPCKVRVLFHDEMLYQLRPIQS